AGRLVRPRPIDSYVPKWVREPMMGVEFGGARPRDAARFGSRTGSWVVVALVVAMVAFGSPEPLSAQVGRVVDLTLENAVEMALDDSYRVRRVRLEVERTRKLLEAEQAGLRSRVFLNFATPEYQQISE